MDISALETSAFGVVHKRDDKYDTDHKQTTMRLASGKKTNVDVGVKPTLTRLRDKGVDTCFSCEGDNRKGWGSSAYVMATHKSSKHVVKDAKKKIKQGTYTGDAKKSAEGFKHGRKEYSARFYRQKKDPNGQMVHHPIGRHIEINRGDPNSAYSYERGIDNLGGPESNKFRNHTTARWPKKDTKNFNEMLDQTKPKKPLSKSLSKSFKKLNPKLIKAETSLPPYEKQSMDQRLKYNYSVFRSEAGFSQKPGKKPPKAWIKDGQMGKELARVNVTAAGNRSRRKGRKLP